MSYSNFHRSRNPFSPARLDEAFKASQIEGGPGDPVKVTIDRDKEKGKVTVTKSSAGKKPKLTEEQKKAANERWANMSEEQKQAARDRKKEREMLSSYTYEIIKTEDEPKPELLDVDMDIEMAAPPEEYTREETEKDTSTTSIGETKTSKDKFKKPGTKDQKFSFTTSNTPGLESTELETTCEMDPDAANKQVCKKNKEAKKKAEKESMYKVKRDGSQKLKKKLVNPVDYLYGRGWRQGRGFMQNVKMVTRKLK